MKHIVVIGASSGIGSAVARQLSDSGHEVTGTWNKHSPEHPGIRFHHFDVLEPATEMSWLPERIDGLVYCPGAITLRPFNRITPDDFRRDYDLQVTGFVNVLQRSLPALKASGNASVVLFSTVAVQNGFSFHSMVSASKGALEGLTRALAAEFAPVIRFNCIAPSLTDTPLASSLLNTEEKRTAHAQRHPMKRIGTPEDMASLASFLLSEESGWITGQIIHADGGMGTIR